MDSMKGLMPNMPGQKKDPWDELNDQCSLTKKQRLYGLIGCMLTGWLLGFFSTLMLISHNLTGFAVVYTLGNIVSISGTGFFIGPCRQCRQMFAKKRVVATLMFLGSLAATLLVAFTVKSNAAVPLCLICVAVQWCALIWYSASYVPFGRKMLRAFLGRCLPCFSA